MNAANFDFERDHCINRTEAVALVLNFQAKLDGGLHFASAFGRSAFEQLLAQPGAAGIRIYRAEHADGSPTMVMVAVNELGEDLCTETSLFMQNTHDCPPNCGTALLAKMR